MPLGMTVPGLTCRLASLSQNPAMIEIRSPLQAQIVQWHVQAGASVRAGELLLVVEAMKMEHEIRAEHDGVLGELFHADGDLVAEGEVLTTLKLTTQVRPELPAAVQALAASASATVALRADLQRVLDRHATTLDANRAEAVAKRHA